ncbi:hypothetical protein [Idiomarina sp. UBA4520]|uniref:hypothetical protein n=1 Tax=Idiomarina sp. UBA4520 TaxID=1946647 RepID=UPI000C439404|nr:MULTISPECIES: hypothetical protein [unclassified Idiomarina]MBF38476.1 hypothetical protein [Idiomarinaceae bacterium]
MKIITSIAVLTLIVSLSGCSATVAEQKQSLKSFENAKSWYLSGDLDSAEHHLQWLHSKGLASSQSWALLGNIYFRQYRFEASEQAYLRSLEFDSSNNDIWFNLALNQLRQTTNTLMDARVQLKETDDQLDGLLKDLLALQKLSIEEVGAQ